MVPDSQLNETREESPLDSDSIVIVDDEESIRELLFRLLTREGYHVETFGDGRSALNVLKNKNFSLIISDFRIPDYNGIELIQEAKKLNPWIGSILITGVGSEQTIIDAFTKGQVNFYLPKPIDIEKFKLQVRLALREVDLKKKEAGFQNLLTQKVQEATHELKKNNELLLHKEEETQILLKTLRKERENIQKTNKLLERLSITDGLTQLYNRRFLEERSQEEFSRAKRYNTTLSCIMMDIDDFKILNDTYGHLQGDEALKFLASVVTKESRQIDIAARYGGEEFIVILPEVDLEGAAVLAERLRKIIERTGIKSGKKSILFTASFGVSTYPQSSFQSHTDLINAADKALYKAKESGKNRVVMNSPSGLVLIGKADVLTSSEKRTILREVSQFVNTSNQLDEILGFLLKNIHKNVGNDEEDFSATVMLLDEHKNLQTKATIRNLPEKNVLPLAKKVMKSGAPIELKASNGDSDISSFPIQYHNASKKRVGVGVCTMNMIPPDKDFVMDLVEVASTAIKNAKINNDLENNTANLERRLGENQLTRKTIEIIQNSSRGRAGSWMNGLEIAAKNLSSLGVRKVLGYGFDPHSKRLVHGKSSFKQPKVPASVSISHLTRNSKIGKILTRNKSKSRNRMYIFQTEDKLLPEDRSLIKTWKLKCPVAICPILIEKQVHGCLAMENPTWLSESVESVRNFVEQINLAFENVHLDNKYLEKTNRLVLLSNLIRAAHDVNKESLLKKFLTSNMGKLATILNSRQISVYRMDEKSKVYELYAFYRKFGRPPPKKVALVQGRLMEHVRKRFGLTKKNEPVCVPDVRKVLKSESRDQYGAMNYIGVPIADPGRASGSKKTFIGILNITEKLDGKKYDDDDMDLASSVGSLISLSLKNVL